MFCQTEPEYVLVYGCLEGHIVDRKLCLMHKELYLAIITSTYCSCGLKFIEVMEDVLPKVLPERDTPESGESFGVRVH
jgi:hypothetical protein